MRCARGGGTPPRHGLGGEKVQNVRFRPKKVDEAAQVPEGKKFEHLALRKMFEGVEQIGGNSRKKLSRWEHWCKVHRI